MKIGTILNHYRITAELGKGGMGEVYRAEDTRLKREVAIKVLPEEISDDPDRLARLQREAQMLAALEHPNIASIYGLEEAAGVRFLVMQLIEGKTLAEHIGGGGLPVDELLPVAKQLADALAHAHERGIVHRDLKCSNLAIGAEGRAVILDFGLAVLAPSEVQAMGATKTALEEAGDLGGTLPYMAPEVLRGRHADGQSDLYSLGVALYEAAAGELPFRGETCYELSSQILTEAASPLPSRVPGTLRKVIMHCLEKDPARRPRGAGELRKALDAPGGGETPDMRSIAVLPLANLSGDERQDYFADGMTEALITDLAKIGALKVISRTSVMRYKGSDKPLPVIARELGVDAIVEGSVLRADDQVRITAQLIRADSDTHLWAESYTREAKNILSLQSEVAQAVAQEIKVKLTPEERARLVDARTVNPDAHEAYLKGRYFWNQRGPGLRKSIEFFERALACDEDYAPAHAGLADAYALLAFYAFAAPREVMPKAKEAALRALEIDEHLAEAHASLGYIYTIFEWDWARAGEELERAIELDPSYGPARVWYGVWLWFMDRIEEGNAEFRYGLECDPLSVVFRTHLGIGLATMRKYAEAIQQLVQGLELDPDFAPARATLGMLYHFQSRTADGIRELQSAVEKSARDSWPLGILGAVYAASGDRQRAQQILAELEKRSESEYIPSTHVAAIYAVLGERDTALEWLNRAYEERAPLIVMCGYHCYPGWAFEGLRDDSRFQDLMHRFGQGAE